MIFSCLFVKFFHVDRIQYYISIGFVGFKFIISCILCIKTKKKNRKTEKKGPPTRYFQLTQTQNELHVDVPLLFRGQLGMDRNLKVNFN